MFKLLSRLGREGRLVSIIHVLIDTNWASVFIHSISQPCNRPNFGGIILNVKALTSKTQARDTSCLSSIEGPEPLSHLSAGTRRCTIFQKSIKYPCSPLPVSVGNHNHHCEYLWYRLCSLLIACALFLAMFQHINNWLAFFI